MTNLECFFLALMILLFLLILTQHVRIARIENKLNGVFWTNGAWWRRG